MEWGRVEGERAKAEVGERGRRVGMEEEGERVEAECERMAQGGIEGGVKEGREEEEKHRAALAEQRLVQLRAGGEKEEAPEREREVDEERARGRVVWEERQGEGRRKR